VLPPAIIDPHDIVVILFVQALFAYMLMFGEVVTVPEEPIFWLTVKTASVLAANENANIVKTIMNIVCALCFAILFPDKQISEY
jgi:hypothetical protein